MHAVSEWEFEPLVVVPLAIALGLYAIGVARLWRKAGAGRGISTWSAVSFAAGWLTLLVALVSPLARLSEVRFSAHMTQHTLLMLVAAPLFAFGSPLLAWLWAIAPAPRRQTAQVFRGRRTIALWRAVTAPLTVFLLQALALWAWHMPSWYEAALHSEAVHALQHLSFVLAGCLFWWAMVEGRYGRRGYGLGVLYVFLTGVHSSLLGALLTVAPSVWYGDYARAGAAQHVDALADQQAAGLIMWIPAGTVFIVLGLALLAAWLGEAERRVRLGAADAASRAGREPRGASLLVPLALVCCALSASACDSRAAARREAEKLTGGNVERGESAIGKYGCGACHTIPGIRGAEATVGPPLTRVAVRSYLGGHLPNSPDNMVKWIQHPQQVDPKNVMPDMGVTGQDARDITAYLYTLR